MRHFWFFLGIEFGNMKIISTTQKFVVASLIAGLGLSGPASMPGWAKQAKKQVITGSVGSYSSSAALAKSGRSTSRLDVSPASKTLKNGLNALRKGKMNRALKARAALKPGRIERKVMAWAIAMKGKGVDAVTLHSIANDLSHWPGQKTMRANLERALVKESNPKNLRVAFGQSQPESDEATIALAQAHAKAGAKRSARAVIAPLWRNDRLTKSQERVIQKTLGSVLTREDYRARAEYLLSKRRIRGAERIAGKAGITRIVKAHAAVERKQKSALSALNAVPRSQKSDPSYLLAKAKHLRQKNKLSAAAKVLLSVKSNKINANSADRYWTEQRILASDLLDSGAPKTAYRLAAHNIAASPSKRIDAEFYAGWIALQKLKHTKTATTHFKRLLSMATTPLSKSRGHYWLGQALAKRGQKNAANEQFSIAARWDTTFYGQLAARKLGKKRIGISKASPSRTDRAVFPRFELVQAIAKLESAGQKNMARTFYRHLARHLKKPGQLALLSARAERQRDYQLALQVGKIGFIRGFNVDTLAWPIGAIPRNTKTSGAGLPLAYAIARQESTFQVDAHSSANALGLLQLLPTTAKRTARNIGIKYSRNRLVTDASYNARLGTAYLNQQMQKFGGSLVLTFAAYNAGPRRAQDWIERYGDPRGKSTEFVINWIEQIPYSETRNYVQRVMENYQVYKARLKGSNLKIDTDLSRGRRG